MTSHDQLPAGIDPNTPIEQQYPPPPGPPASHAPIPTSTLEQEKTAGNFQYTEHPLVPEQQYSTAPPPYSDEGLYAPPLPQRPNQMQNYAPPPQHPSASFANDDLSDPVHYTRDPHRLIGYLVPFPKPNLPGVDPAKIPARFLIYTPPPPPLQAPTEGEKEAKAHKLQRKWQTEVREAKQSDAKLASWKGLKSRATKGISWAINSVTSADLEFLGRVPGDKAQPEKSPRASLEDKHTEDGKEASDHRTVGLEALDMIYPPSLASAFPGGEQELRREFIESMMRTKSKAQRDAVIGTGLLPVSAAVDLLATLIWPFGGLLEVDAVWTYASIRGAKTSRSVTKRLASSTKSGTLGDHHEDTKEQLQLHFLPSSRLEILRRYLAARCAEKDPKLFSSREAGTAPTETTVLEAIGWEPSQVGGATRNWEDEQWETQEVKDDLKMVMSKAAKSWDKWCKNFEKNPEKALKK